MEDKSAFPTSCEQAKNSVIKRQASNKSATLVHTNALAALIEFTNTGMHSAHLYPVYLTHT